MSVRPAWLFVLAWLAFGLGAPAAFADNVDVTFEIIGVTPPSGGQPYTVKPLDSKVFFEAAANETATVYVAAYVEAQSTTLEQLTLSYQWDSDGDLLQLAQGAAEPGILYGPTGSLERSSNPFLDPDNLVSGIRGIDYARPTGLFPASNKKDLATLLVFDVDLDPAGYTDPTTTLEVRAGIFDAQDGILDTAMGLPTFNGATQAMGQNPSTARIGVVLPEPGFGTLLLAGTGALALLERRRVRRHLRASHTDALG